MIKKLEILFKILFILFLTTGLALGNTQAGRAQSASDWSTPVNLSSSGVATTPVLLVDFRGTIHAIWVDEVDGYKYSYSTDGVKWSFPVTVAFPFATTDSVPTLLADANGSINIFWINRRGELFYGQTNPDEFGSPSKWIVTRLSRHASNFDVLIDSQQKLHIAYIENVTNNLDLAGVYYRQSIVGGGFWSNPVRVYQSEYFRATTALDTYVRVAVSGKPNSQKIFISWDNRPQKRIFIASSDNTGEVWSDVQPFKSPDDTGGVGLPFNFSVWASGENVLLMWQVGEPGASRCFVYSQWSADEGNTWGDTMTLFGGPAACSTGIEFVRSQNDKVVVLMNNPGDPTLIAWNGSQWSEPQSEVKLPPFSNPATFDAILLGCRQNVIYQDKLFVVGCDQAKGGDVWFLSRALSPLDGWFSPSSVWSDPTVLESEGKKITFLSSVADSNGNIHAVWVNSSLDQSGFRPFIQYSRWNGNEWSTPETIIRNLDGVPLNLTMSLDKKDRLMLAWVNGSKGDLMFTWANLDQTNLSSGWSKAVVLPSPSQLNSSPDIVVDSTGRIVVVYAVPLNENRGIYTVQSTDNGFTWSSYVQVFDAIASQWERIDSPKIALSGDGGLHLLFTRQALRADQPTGLYYSQSRDGGVTWSDPQVVSEGKIYWSDIVAYGKQSVHRLWQEDNGLVIANLSQISQDSGANWGGLLDVTGVSEHASPVTLAADDTGGLYFIQLLNANTNGIINEDKFVLQDWKWDGARWNSDVTKELSIKGKGIQYFVTAAKTPKNYLSVSLAAEYSNLKGTINDEIISVGRFLEDAGVHDEVISPIIPIPSFPSNGSLANTTDTPTPVVDLSALNENNNPTEGISKNLIGVILIGLTGVVLFVLFLRRGRRQGS